jgi:predicted nucleic acid-binding protein
MRIADTSFLVEAILRNAQLLADEALVTPDLTLYETANALWRHETLISDLKDGSRYLDLLEDLMEAGTITVIRPDRALIKDAYDLSIRYRVPVYDMIFVALSLRLEMELRTFDKDQMNVYNSEKRI